MISLVYMPPPSRVSVRFTQTRQVLFFVSLVISANTLAQHQHLPQQANSPVATNSEMSATTTAAPTPAPNNTGGRQNIVDSAFARYQRFNADETLNDWSIANRTVAEIGGWRAYAKEAARASQATPNPSAEKVTTPAAENAIKRNVAPGAIRHDAHTKHAPSVGAPK